MTYPEVPCMSCTGILMSHESQPTIRNAYCVEHAHNTTPLATFSYITVMEDVYRKSTYCDCDAGYEEFSIKLNDIHNHYVTLS